MKKRGNEILLIIVLVILILLLALIFYNPQLLGIKGHSINLDEEEPQLDSQILDNADVQIINGENETEKIINFDENSQNTNSVNDLIVDSLSSEAEEIFTGIIRLGEIKYQKILPNKVEINSLSLTLRNNLETMSLEVLVYISDLNDSEDKKGLVREQIWFGLVENDQVIRTTKEVSAIYLGDLLTDKEVKVSLIGYKDGNSINLGTDSKTTSFD
ncbi:hypothetical protein COY27_04450 [Candidatus Woesearchaeota archaeon CG_4_10_14_0_2_um_filter_33_13]|nr:MAG: hypothetical protein COY27_04450 [Candidatus Woesearchaeota archaeon CG_4_10_14_0_2_um_filter_33_13]